MAVWKKIIVSGSSAHLANVNVDSLSSGVVTGATGNLTTTQINGSGHILATTGASGSVMSGSFSGSFQGDGSGITGIASTLSFSGSGDAGGVDTLNLKTETIKFEGGPGLSSTAASNTVTYNLASGIISASSLGTNTTQGQALLVQNGSSGSAVTINSLGTTGTPTFASVTTTGNATVGGNLTVNGSLTTISTTNTNIKDQFLLLNSGSATATDESGIIFGGANGTRGNGAALVWNGDYNSNDGRLAIANSVNSDATTATVSYYVGGVFDGTEADAATAQADHRGNIRVDSSNDIWIYA